MIKMIFSKDILPICAYCEHGRQIVSTNDVLCSKKGVVSAEHSCRKFRYDPFSRIPPKKGSINHSFTKEDFEF